MPTPPLKTQLPCSKLKIKQVKSKNGANHAQRETLRSLGARAQINSIVERRTRRQLRGMIHRVRHLIKVEE